MGTLTRTARVVVTVTLLAFAALLMLGTAHDAWATEPINELTDEEYSAFGLHPVDPEEFSDGGEPLEDYAPVVYAELYLGTMNAKGQSHYEGSFRVLNESSGLSKDKLSVKSDSRTLVGSQTTLDSYDDRFQTQNACAVDVDVPSGADHNPQDEIAELVLCGTDDGVDEAHLSLYRLSEDGKGDTWDKSELASWELTSSDTKYVESIDANTSKGYVGLAAGDYDGDGADEIACYVPARTGAGPFVAIIDGDGAELQRITLASIDARFNVCASSWTLKGSYMPAVSLVTTSVSGQDDLVVCVSNPLKDGIDQRSALAIYRCADGGLARVFTDTTMTSSAGHRMRFCSATDADLLGNGHPVLVVGGYENYDFDSYSDAGRLSSKNNMVQLIGWDEKGARYATVWDDPLDDEIAYGSKLSVSTAQMEPAAMAAGRLRLASTSERVFLEGVVLRFRTADSTTSEAWDMLRAGTFTVESRTALSGDNSAFISQAEIAHFCATSPETEQLVVLQGDLNTFNSINDKVYYDVCWGFELSGELTSMVTDNDLVESDQDDNGTYASICALNADRDTLLITYVDRTMGWSEPELDCVVQSTPYWRELVYEDGPGSVAFELTSGSMSGRDWDFDIGVGGFIHGDALWGLGLADNNVMLGFSFDFSVVGKYVHEHSFSKTDTTSWRVVFSPGEDNVVVFCIPVVTYHYRAYIPEHEVSEEEKALLDEFAPEKSIYAVGDVRPGEWQDMYVSNEGNPCLSHLTLARYNELVNELSDKLHLEPITDEELVRYRTIGDPSTYPKTEADLKAITTTKDLMVSDTAVEVAAGDGEQWLTYTYSYENEDGDGFHIDAEGALAFAVEADLSLGVATKLDGQAGGKGVIGGGSIWTGANSHGKTFSGVFSDLPEGTDEAYGFTSNMAVYRIDFEEADDPFAVAFTAQTTIDDELPPALPADLRVFGTTESEVVLRWGRGETRREPTSWQVFVRDNNGFAQLVGTTNEPWFVATDLDPATSYQFALVACSGEGGKGRKSSRSAWVTAVTKEATEGAPYFTLVPHNTRVHVGAKERRELACEAHAGTEGATISYQWQCLAVTTGAEPAWVDVEDATEATLTLPTLESTGLKGSFLGSDGETYGSRTYFRVIATQKKGSNVHSTISRTAAMVAYADGGENPDADLPNVTLTIPQGQDGVRGRGGLIYFTEASAPVTLDARLTDSDGQPIADADLTLEVKSVEREDLLVAQAGGDATTTYAATTDEQGLATRVIAAGTLPEVAEVRASFAGREDGGVSLGAAASEPIGIVSVDHLRISYDANGGTQDARNPGVLTGEGAPTTLLAPARAGYDFKGWYDGETKVTRLPTEELLAQGEVKLRAAWEPISYDIAYELAGGANAPENPRSYTVEGSVAFHDPTRAGYTFAGWFEDAAHTSPFTGIKAGATGTLTLYAAWEKEAANEAGGDPGRDPSKPAEGTGDNDTGSNGAGNNGTSDDRVRSDGGDSRVGRDMYRLGPWGFGRAMSQVSAYGLAPLGTGVRYRSGSDVASTIDPGSRDSGTAPTTTTTQTSGATSAATAYTSGVVSGNTAAGDASTTTSAPAGTSSSNQVSRTTPATSTLGQGSATATASALPGTGDATDGRAWACALAGVAVVTVAIASSGRDATRQ